MFDSIAIASCQMRHVGMLDKDIHESEVAHGVCSGEMVRLISFVIDSLKEIEADNIGKGQGLSRAESFQPSLTASGQRLRSFADPISRVCVPKENEKLRNGYQSHRYTLLDSILSRYMKMLLRPVNSDTRLRRV